MVEGEVYESLLVRTILVDRFEFLEYRFEDFFLEQDRSCCKCGAHLCSKVSVLRKLLV